MSTVNRNTEITPPQYLIDAAQDESGEYHNFVVHGYHPPKWLFDPSIKSGKGAIGGALVASNPSAYNWNIIRRRVANGGALTTEQVSLLKEEVPKYSGEETEWFLACKKFVS